MKSKLWKRYFPTKDLWESTLLIIGLGDIGTQLALRAKAHGLRVLAVKRTATEKPSYVDELGTEKDLDAFLVRADYLVLCAASTDQTEHLLDERRIALLPPGSYVFNVGRGNLLDEQALVQALQSGRIKGAGLDVTTIEPLPQDHVLWTMDAGQCPDHPACKRLVPKRSSSGVLPVFEEPWAVSPEQAIDQLRRLCTDVLDSPINK